MVTSVNAAVPKASPMKSWPPSLLQMQFRFGATCARIWRPEPAAVSTSNCQRLASLRVNVLGVRSLITLVL